MSTLTLYQTTNVKVFQTERFCTTTISNLMKMAESFQNDQKTLWEKEKLLVTSNFTFTHRVFKRPVLQTHKNQGLFGKGLNNPWERGLLKTLEKRENSCNLHFLLFAQ